MGIIISKFKKKKTTYEILEKLENEIETIEEFRRNTEQTQKKMVGRFVVISTCVYCLTAFILYFYFFPATAYERAIYIVPLILLPVLLVFIKRFLTWYYSRKIKKNQNKLSILQEEKKKILDDVKDKETYTVAKQILDKFAPEPVKRSTSLTDLTPIKSNRQALSSSVLPVQSGLRYRDRFSNGNKSVSLAATPRTQLFNSTTLLPKTPFNQSIVPTNRPTVSGTPLLLPRAVLPRERSVLDKMVDYLVGDGPANRYALICKSCSSHNGMALKEEFDYLSFRCCYCLNFNAARKKRPAAPKLEGTSSTLKSSDLSESDRRSSSATSSSSDVDEANPFVTEPTDSDEKNKTQVDKVNSVADVDKLSDSDVDEANPFLTEATDSDEKNKTQIDS